MARTNWATANAPVSRSKPQLPELLYTRIKSLRGESTSGQAPNKARSDPMRCNLVPCIGLSLGKTRERRCPLLVPCHLADRGDGLRDIG